MLPNTMTIPSLRAETHSSVYMMTTTNQVIFIHSFSLDVLFVSIDTESGNVIDNKRLVIYDSVYEFLEFNVETEDNSRRKSSNMNAYGASSRYLEYLDREKLPIFRKRNFSNQILVWIVYRDIAKHSVVNILKYQQGTPEPGHYISVFNKGC